MGQSSQEGKDFDLSERQIREIRERVDYIATPFTFAFLKWLGYDFLERWANESTTPHR